MCQSTQQTLSYIVNQQCKFEQTPVFFFRRTRCYDTWQNTIYHCKYWRRLQSFTRRGLRGTSALLAPLLDAGGFAIVGMRVSTHTSSTHLQFLIVWTLLHSLSESFILYAFQQLKLSQWVYRYLWMTTSAYILCLPEGHPLALFFGSTGS